MAEVLTKTYVESKSVINQCDIFRDIEYIEYVKEDENTIEVSKIIFHMLLY